MENNRQSVRMTSAIRRLSVEILVGFIGVYAAFALNAYKEKRELVDRRHQIKRALYHEIAPLVENPRRNSGDGGYRAYMTAFDSAVKAGKKPVPRPFIEPLGLNMHMWEATKQSGGLEIIDVPTFERISQFYNNWSQMAVFYGQLRDLSVNTILPLVPKGGDAFYDPKTGEPRYDIGKIYYFDLEALANLTDGSVRSGTSVLTLLAADTT